MVIFNKAMEYSLLRVFVKGSNQNAESKAACTKLILSNINTFEGVRNKNEKSSLLFLFLLFTKW